VLLLDFYCKENDRFPVVPINLGLLTSDYGVHEVGLLFVESTCPGCMNTTRNL
jgi:hypothetical protein